MARRVAAIFRRGGPFACLQHLETRFGRPVVRPSFRVPSLCKAPFSFSSCIRCWRHMLVRFSQDWQRRSSSSRRDVAMASMAQIAAHRRPGVFAGGGAVAGGGHGQGRGHPGSHVWVRSFFFLFLFARGPKSTLLAWSERLKGKPKKSTQTRKRLFGDPTCHVDDPFARTQRLGGSETWSGRSSWSALS